MLNVRTQAFGLVVNGLGRIKPDTYFKRNNAFLSPRVRSPNNCPLPFF